MPASIATTNTRPLPLPPTSAVTAGPGHRPTRPQPIPNSVVPTNRRASSGRSSGIRSAGATSGGPAGECQPVDRAERRGRASHHDEQRGIPRAGDVEEGEHDAWIGHPRDRQARAEEEPGGEADDDRLHDSHPPRRTTNTTIIATAMNVAQPTIDRRDRRPTPQTPCPLVQPPP